MGVKLYLDGVKVSKKYVQSVLEDSGLGGKELLDRYIEEAKQGYMIDPLEQQSYFLGSLGVLSFEFTL